MSTFVVEAYASENSARARALNVDGTVIGPVSRVVVGEPGVAQPVWVDRTTDGARWLVTFADG